MNMVSLVWAAEFVRSMAEKGESELAWEDANSVCVSYTSQHLLHQKAGTGGVRLPQADDGKKGTN